MGSGTQSVVLGIMQFSSDTAFRVHDDATVNCFGLCKP